MDVDEEFEPPTSSSSKGDKKRFEVKKVSIKNGAQKNILVYINRQGHTFLYILENQKQ